MSWFDLRLLYWLTHSVGWRKHFLDVICRKDEPLLTTATSKFGLADLTIGSSLVSFDIDRHPIAKGHQMTCLPSPLPLGDWYNLDIAALKVSGVDLHKSAIIFIFILNPDGRIAGDVDEGIFMVVLQDVEELAGGTKVVIEHDFLAAILHAESFLLIEDTDDFIGYGGSGCKE